MGPKAKGKGKGNSKAKRKALVKLDTGLDATSGAETDAGPASSEEA